MRLIKRLLAMAVGRRRAQSLRALLGGARMHAQRPMIRRPEGGSITVLAPHMDDEVLGAGGTIARHVQAGAEVSVIFLTDGRYGSDAHVALAEPDRGRRERALIDIRKEEARHAGDVLGVKNIIFLDAEDGRLRADSTAPLRLRSALDRVRPQVVYLPFLLENHVDHCAATGVLMAATAGTDLDFECRCYEVWTPLFPNMAVEIDDVLDLKKRALGCYRSQLAHMDYVHTGIALNAYRSSAIGCKTARYVEAFFALSLADYRRLYRATSRFL
jgi:LmbE family N-acetylglucosaminyl deacetylase